MYKLLSGVSKWAQHLRKYMLLPTCASPEKSAALYFQVYHEYIFFVIHWPDFESCCKAGRIYNISAWKNSWSYIGTFKRLYGISFKQRKTLIIWNKIEWNKTCFSFYLKCKYVPSPFPILWQKLNCSIIWEVAIRIICWRSHFRVWKE